jgi:hypothetical protein
VIARRILLAVVALAFAVPGCAFFRDPIQPWQKDIVYEKRGDAVIPVPNAVTVDAPFGYVLLTNDTTELRGFAIDDLAVYERIKPEATVRIRVDEARNRRTYLFYDHLHPGTIRGRIVTRFVAEEER